MSSSAGAVQSTMKAVVVDKWLKGVQELRVVDWPVPEIDDDSVLVRIEIVGANFFDILLVTGKYQFKPSFPFIPGAEFAGYVAKIGANVTEYKVGDRVCGGVMNGAYAEYIACIPQGLFRLPDSISFEHAASFHSTYATSYGALKIRAQLKPGETVLVHAGAGGVGLCAVQIAKALGASKVIATAGTDAKCEIAKRIGGADYAINYTTTDWQTKVKEITDGVGVDVVYDPVGLVEESTKCIAWNGRILVIGFAGGTIPKVAVNRALLKNCSIVGFMWGGYMQNEPEVLPKVYGELMDLLRQGKFKSVAYDHVYNGLEEAPAALEALGSRATWGKVVIRPRRLAGPKL